jgi:hypothetical protein
MKLLTLANRSLFLSMFKGKVDERNIYSQGQKRFIEANVEEG